MEKITVIRNKVCNCSREQMPRPGESGYMLLAVVFMVAILTLSLSVAVPRIIQEIQRDKELECMHRGQQYVRALRLYYRRTGNYPTDVSQLENTNNIRFLRKRYLDPITNREWKLVYQGDVKPEILMQTGFFGGPAVSASSGQMPAGVIAGLAGGTPSATSGFGGNGGVSQLLNPATGQPASGPGPSGSQAVPDSLGNSTDGTTGTASTLSGTRRIVGVSGTSSRKSIRIYKKQTHYNDWQFVYDPASDGIMGGGQPGLNGPSLPASPAAPLPGPPPTKQ